MRNKTKLTKDCINVFDNMNTKLKESGEKCWYLFDKIPIGVGIADFKGNILRANKAMLNLTGYTLDELKNINLTSTYLDQDKRKQ